MKKLLVSLAVLMSASLGVNAQEVGQIWVGGSVHVLSAKPSGGSSSTSYGITPEVGYVMTDNLGIGIKIGYGHSETGTAKVKTDEFTVNPFARYSFLKGDIGKLFVDGGIGYTNSKIKGGAKTNEFEVGFRPGVAVNLSNRLALTGQYGFLGYTHTKMGDAKVNAYGFNFDLSNVRLGLNLLF